MQANDMVQMEMREEEIDRQIIVNVLVGFVDAVSCIEDDMVSV